MGEVEIIEEWKDIKGYEGYYQVSNYGRVRSVDRYGLNNWGNAPKFYKGKILKPGTKAGGYLFVGLHYEGKLKAPSVHRLVAEAFLPNPDNLPQVNHKDENKQNNFVWVNPDGSVDPEKSNLEWCTASYNANYGTARKRAAVKTKEWIKNNGHPLLGKHHSEETKKKISDSHRKYTDEEIKEHRKKYVDKNREKYRQYWKDYYYKKRIQNNFV